MARAVAFLKSQAGQIPEKEATLVAYALLKAGEPVTSELIQHGVNDAIGRSVTGYTGYDHIYLAGVDALLLSEVDSVEYFPALQKIADHVSSRQHSTGGWSESQDNADTSMAQYGMLALWAAKGAGVKIAPEVVERNVAWHLANGTPDGSWAYRPKNPNTKQSHNLSMAGAGSLGIGRMLLYGPKTKPKTVEPQKKFGILEKDDGGVSDSDGLGFKDYRPQIPAATIDARIERAFSWIDTRFPPPQGAPEVLFPYYFYYALERAAALHELGDVKGKNWFETYGDLLIAGQNAEGAFDRGSKQHSSSTIGTSFAVLYLMRSTQQIIDKQFGKGLLKGNRGLDNLFAGDKKEKKELGELDELLGAMENVNFDKLDVSTEDIVEKITFSSRDELVGQVDMLMKLLESPDAANRQVAYWALGRTGDFALVPLMLKGLRDSNVDCNVEALNSLRYISRKPNGFGLSLNPLEGADSADEARKVEVANEWRTKAYKTWGNWYRTVRPFDEGGGLDELELGAR
ncbi:MAG: hypothetical protein R3C59_02925 [Planctomycetaceae bacterium]